MNIRIKVLYRDKYKDFHLFWVAFEKLNNEGWQRIYADDRYWVLVQEKELKLGKEGIMKVETRDQLWKAYKEAIAPAREACVEAIAQAWEAYEEDTTPIWEAYEKAYKEATEKAE